MTSNLLTQFPGAYALELYLPRPEDIAVGRFGRYHFEKGKYIYLGSANGPGGINARLGRHINGNTHTLHWHIDYLRYHAHPIAFNFVSTNGSTPAGKPIECCWSQALASHSSTCIPVPGFGSSDCAAGCEAHLVFYSQSGSEKNQIHPVFLNQASVLCALAQAIDTSVDKLNENFTLIKTELELQYHW